MRSGPLRRAAATAAAHVPQRTHFKSLVSFARAPGFRQASLESLRLPVDLVPITDVGAFVIPDVVTESEEAALLSFTTPLFERLPYSHAHVDALIHHFKEFYRPYDQVIARALNPTSDDFNGIVPLDCKVAVDDRVLDIAADVFRRLHGLVAGAYLPSIPLTNRVHFLQIHGDGFIRAHVDESRNSSGVVAGLTLGSGRAMTLTHPHHPGAKVDLLLAPRSFYILASRARYEWLHSVDWEEEDENHLRRIVESSASAEPGAALAKLSVHRAQRREVAVGSPVFFEGQDSGLRRGTRTALIFRGVSPMELMLRRMRDKKAHT